MGCHQLASRFPAISFALAIALCSSPAGLLRSAESASKSGLSRFLPSDATHYVAFRSSLRIEKAIAGSSLGREYRAAHWKAIANEQKEKRIGSLLNPSPWLGFPWEALSGLDAQGLLFSTQDSVKSRRSVCVLVFPEPAGSMQFINAWSLSESGSASELNHANTPGANKQAKWFQGALTKNWLVHVENIVAVSPSKEHLARWFDQTISTGTKVANRPLPQTSELENFEDSKRGDLFMKMNINEFFSEEFRSSSPAFIAWKKSLLPSLVSADAIVYIPEGTESWRIEYRLHTASRLADAAKLLSLRSDLNVAMPPFQFPSHEAWSVVNVDTREWYQGLSKAMNIFIDPKVPGLFEDMVDAILTDPEGPRLDLKNELFYRCKPGITTISKTSELQDGVAVRDYLWVLELGESVDARTMAKKLFAGDDVVSNRQIRDYSAWFTEGKESLLISAESESTNTVRALACNDRYLLVSTSLEWLEESLAKENENAVNLAKGNMAWDLRMTASEKQNQSIMQGIDGSKSFRLDWECVRSLDESSLLAVLFTESVLGGHHNAKELRSKLPSWDLVRNAFGIFSHLATKKKDSLEGVWYLD